MNASSSQKYVSRGGDKLASVAQAFSLDFRGKTVLDVGSSTGGFTDFALQHGAARVIAVESGTNQLHPRLRADKRIELFEKTDIRDFKLAENPEIAVIDVSFISLREILPAVSKLADQNTLVVALLKPQFEAKSDQKHEGIVKNDRIRRQIFKDFESWAKRYFVIINKADSGVAGATGNRERFYLLRSAHQSN